MDFNGRNNAKSAFEDQIDIMDEAIEDELITINTKEEGEKRVNKKIDLDVVRQNG